MLSLRALAGIGNRPECCHHREPTYARDRTRCNPSFHSGLRRMQRAMMGTLAHMLTRWRLALPLTALANGLAAQSPTPSAIRPLKIEDVVGAVRFQHLLGFPAATVSSDGEWLAYTVCDPRKRGPDTLATNSQGITAGQDIGRMSCDVWLTNAATGQSHGITHGEGTSWAPSFSPDGKSLAFFSERHNESHLWLWDRRTGSVHQVSTVITRTYWDFESPVWTPDNRHVMVKLRPFGMAEAELNDGGSSGSETKDSVDRTPGSTVAVFRSAPRDSLDSLRTHDSTTNYPADNQWLGDLALVDVVTRRARVLASRVRTNCYLVSPDGSQIAYLDFKGRLDDGKEGASTYALLYDLVVIDIATMRSRVVAERLRQWYGTSLSWSPNGKWLAYISGDEPARNDYREPYTLRGNLYVVAPNGGPIRKFGDPANLFKTIWYAPLWDPKGEELYLTDDHRLWRATVSTGELTPLTEASRIKPAQIIQAAGGGRIWSPDSAAIYFVTEDSVTKRSGIYRVDIGSGEVTRVREENRRYDTFSSGATGSPNGQWVALRVQSATESEDLWIADASFSRANRITILNPQLGPYTFGVSRVIEFRSSDGQPLQAALLLPAGYVQGSAYPLVVWVYASEYGSEWANSFGLTGFPSFNMQMLSTRGYAVLLPDVPVHWGTTARDLMNAVMPAIDRVVGLGIADPERLVVMGESNGGWSTLALLAQTTRFKAAVMNAGFGDLVALYGQMSPIGQARWIPVFEGLTLKMGAPPWEVPQRYIENSPIFYLDRVHTPLLIQVGSADYGFPALSEEVFVGLRRLGRDVTYLKYRGEGHVLTGYPNLVDYWNRLLAFFDAHLAAEHSTHSGGKLGT